MKGSCLILFRSDSCTLERAEQELRAYNLQVHQNGNSLMVERSGSPEISNSWFREPHVIKEAQEIAGRELNMNKASVVLRCSV